MKNFIKYILTLLRFDEYTYHRILNSPKFIKLDITKLKNWKNKLIPNILIQFYLKFGEDFGFLWLNDPIPMSSKELVWIQETFFEKRFNSICSKTINIDDVFIFYEEEGVVYFVDLGENFEDPIAYFAEEFRYSLKDSEIITRKKKGRFSYFLFSSILHEIKKEKPSQIFQIFEYKDDVTLDIKSRLGLSRFFFNYISSNIINANSEFLSYLGFLLIDTNKIYSRINPEIVEESKLKKKSEISSQWIRVDKLIDGEGNFDLSQKEMNFLENLKKEIIQKYPIEKFKIVDRMIKAEYEDSNILKKNYPKYSWGIIHQFENSAGHHIGFYIERNQIIGLILEQKQIEFSSQSFGNLRKLRFLNLKRNLYDKANDDAIQELPEEIGDLENLEYLELSWNYLKKLPKAIGKLKKLKYLGLNYCQLEEIPQELCNNENLEYLYLKGNKIKEIPPQLWNLKKLKTLIISENNLTELKIKDGNMNALKILDASDNCINEIDIQPDTVPNLEILNLSNNFIAEIPDSILHLKNLADLRIVNNEVFKIPESIEYTTNLRYINLEANQIKSIPEEFTKLLKLEQFNFAFNFISEVPINLTDLPNLKSGNLIGNNLKQPILVDVRKPKHPFIFQQANDFEEDEFEQKNMVIPDDYY